MKTAIKILRVILLAVVSLAIGLPAISYVILSTDWAQTRLCAAAEEALTTLLGTDASVESVDFSPFNRLKINGVKIDDDYEREALYAKTIDARFELIDFILSQKIIVDYVVIDGLDLKVYKLNPDSKINISDIIERFKKKDEKKEQTKFLVRLNSVEIINSKLSYNVVSEPSTPEKFNPSHIALEDFNIEVFAPKISNDEYIVNVYDMNFVEQSGFRVTGLDLSLFLSDKLIKIDNFKFKTPNSLIEIAHYDSKIDSIPQLAKIGTEIPTHLRISPESHIYLPDFKAFYPKLAEIDNNFNLNVDIEGLVNDFTINTFAINTENNAFAFDTKGSVSNKDKDINTLILKDIALQLRMRSAFASKALSNFGLSTPPSLSKMLATTKEVNILGKYSGTISDGAFDINASTNIGKVNANGDFKRQHNKIAIKANSSIERLNIGLLANNDLLGTASGSVDANITLNNKDMYGDVDFNFNELDFKEYRYHNIAGDASINDSTLYVNLNINDPNLELSLVGNMEREQDKFSKIYFISNINNIRPDALNLYDGYKGYRLACVIKTDIQGISLSQFKGNVDINHISFINSDGEGLRMRNLNITANNLSDFNTISINSDILKGNIEGRYDLGTIGKLANRITVDVFPSLIRTKKNGDIDITDNNNDFTYDFTISKAESFSKFFKLPVTIIDPVNISGEVSAPRHLASLTVDAPWLLQGNKLIDNSYITGCIDGLNRNVSLFITTHMPTKKGPMDMIATVKGLDGKLSTNIDWLLERDIPINGKIYFDTELSYDFDNNLVTTVTLNPGQINFGNDLWNIHPSTIKYENKSIDVSGFSMDTETQRIDINGKASDSPYDILTVSLKDIKLIDIFETLDIDKALICGEATGDIFASQLFDNAPQLFSNNLHVKDIGYNRCVFGDGDIKVFYDSEKGCFNFDADITNSENDVSHIQGSITPATEGLDFYFDTKRIRAGFLQPFMVAFCSDIDGLLTGQAHLFGTFKYIDLEGDVYAESLKMKLDFTNTCYYATTKVHIAPGIINLRDITLRDMYGNTALLNGYVKHVFFKEPSFEFDITEASNFLSYDVKEETNSRWFGRIFGNGSVFVNGKPGEVNISANMSTAPNSTFTFQLLDSQDAQEYSFITFNDVTPKLDVDKILGIVVESESEKKIRQAQTEEGESNPTAYNLDLNIDINTNAQINLVMDPQGGDMIKSYGNGNLQMAYHSQSDDIWLLGTYTLEKGDYNFTFQNIIIKDFKIREGSSITFTGDPYQGILNIDAIYSTNANLSDLDESFLNDKELNRTNVQVYAVMKVTGNMMQPDISFDLEFPTLNQDIYRKVRSIVSTDEMMNRQIIYLLALNRFYTPEYMASTTKGSELFSVASSTISSQLSNMLGKLSENWSIAPNLRSDRGDFSDVEVDVNLSSSLLNNRLLFNGNFGYRDKSLNTNQFIGDFDIEYLLNRKGSLRLKAYNRYNDQNYYLRTSQTTQGVGIMYKKDFDRIFGFLRRKKSTEPTDTLVSPTVQTDTIQP